MLSRSKKLAHHSVRAALAAIEIYNKPDFPDREQVFAILMVTAWESLFKARVLQQGKNQMQALYVREGKKFKRNRNKLPFTIDIYEAMRRAKVDPIVESNVSLLVEIRDAAIHLTASSPTLPYLVFTLGSATLRNYAKLAYDWFGTSLANYHFYIMPLAFSAPFKTLKVADLKKEPDEIRVLIESVATQQIQNQNTSTNDFHFLCEIETHFVSAKKLTSSTDLSVVVDPSNADAIVVQKAVSALDIYPLTATELVKKVRQALPKIKPNQVWDAIKLLKLKGDKKYSKYSYPNKAAERIGPTKATGVIYNHDAVQSLIEHFEQSVGK